MSYRIKNLPNEGISHRLVAAMRLLAGECRRYVVKTRRKNS